MATPARAQIEEVVRTIFKRCVDCPSGVPSCPQCSDGQMCSQIPPSCYRCARTECVTMSGSSAPSTDDSGSGPNVGAIAGGVIGGLIFMAVLIWLVWRYGLKGRRQQEEQWGWDEQERPEEKYTDDFTMRRDARASTHTVASMASTVLTRASNIIQIAYIPGITNRSGPGSPQPLVPPVPPIPAAMAASPSTPHSPYSDADLHFLPGDIRDSTYTDGRNSYARSSVAPSMARTSVASTVYRNNAIVSPQPAQTVVRGKAAMVSVKSNSNESTPAQTPGVDAPMMPAIPAHIQKEQAKVKSPGGSVRSIAQMGKPLAINMTKKKSGDQLTSPSSASSGSLDPNGTGQTNPAIHAALAAASSTRPLDASPNPSSLSPGTTNSSRNQQSRQEQLSPASYFDSESEEESSPFADSAQKKKIAEAVRRASKTADQRSRSPFSDDHAVNDR